MYSLILKVQKWRLFAASFSSAGAAAEIFGVSYLVDSLGFTTKLAESISRKVSSGNPDSVLSLLKSHGFTDPQISSILRGYPGLFMLDAEQSLGPKLQYLKSRVASSFEFTEVLSKAPKILKWKEDKTISIYYDFVKQIIEADKSSKYLKLCPSLGSKQENSMRNVSVLREIGVPQNVLISLLLSDNKLVSGKDRFEESLKKVMDKGFDPKRPKFVEALNVMYCLSDKSVEEKVKVYGRFGFNVGDVWYIFKKFPKILALSEKNIANSIATYTGIGFSRDEFIMMVVRHPPCMSYSSESVKKKTEFVVQKMNWPLNALVSNPQVFGLSLEERIVPRCQVIQALMSKGLVSELPSLMSLVCTNQKFLNKYVMKHDDKEVVAEMMAVFRGGSS